MTAHRIAKACGKRVEILAGRTETAQVFANPSGNYTYESTLKPVRVHRPDGSWVPADATLRRDADGTVSPVAAALPIVFSGGGTAPIARIAKGDKELTLGWLRGRTLPAPVLSGATATYPEVLPGVDLTVTADVDGFSEVLVVKTRAAAKDPELRRLTFRTSARGLAVKVDPSTGAVAAVDPTGAVVFGGSTPMLWDDGANAPHAAAAAAPMDGDRPLPKQRAMPATADATTLTVVPDAALLDSPDTVYPVRIDPTFPGGKLHWTMLWKEFGGTSYWDRSCVNCDSAESQSGVVRVGYQAFSGVSTIRSLFQMDTSGFRGATVTKATFSLTQSWSGKACGGAAGPTSLWFTNGIDSSLTWNKANSIGFQYITKMGSNSQVRRYNGSGGCAKGTVEWDAMAAARWAAGANSTQVTVGLRADNEGDEYAWRRYQLDPRLSVEYDYPPRVPDRLTVAATPQDPGQPCVTGAGRPAIRSTAPTLKAHVTDPDGDQMQVWFAWAKWDPTQAKWVDVANAFQDHVANDGTAQVTAPNLVDGGIYTYRSQANDYQIAGPVTNSPGNCEFQVDVTPPGLPGSVSSSLYATDGSFHGSPGLPGDFTITPPATNAADVDHYVYALTPYTTPPTDGTRTVTASPTDHTATVSLSPVKDGLNELRVWAVDRAGNTSPIASPYVYQFKVGDPSGPVGRWAGDDPAGSSTLADSSGYGHDAKPYNVTFGTPGRIADGPTAPTFDGSASGASTEFSGTVGFDTGRSYSVAAWVRLTGTGITDVRDAVSRDGGHTNAFVLGYSGADNKWVFSVSPTDDSAAATTKVLSDAPAGAGVWTYLVGVYDSTSRGLSLYVNGVKQATTATSPGAFSTNGALEIGKPLALFTANATPLGPGIGHFPGQIADVAVWNRVLASDEIGTVLTNGSLAGSWSLDGGGSDDTGLHDAIPSSQVRWGPDRFGNPGTAAVLDPAGAAALGTTVPALHTDQSFTVSAWVLLTGNAANYTAVSQIGTHTAAFLLKYDHTANRWRFSISVADVESSTGVGANSTTAPTLNRWTHLVGVYDAGTHQATLYVDGVSQGTVGNATGYATTGPLYIGRAQYNSMPSDYWPGSVDAVQIYQGALPPAAVANL